MIAAKQIRAARALLDWSQDELALATNLSVTTIRNIESGDMSPRIGTLTIIGQVMESAGIEFTDGDGVKQRNDDIKIFQGADSCNTFFNDIRQTIKENSSEIVSVFRSQEILLQVCGEPNGKLGRLALLGQYATIKCLLPEALEPSLHTASFQFRTILKQHIGPSSYFVYGHKHAIILKKSSSYFRFVVFDSFTAAQDYRNYFYTLWEMAPPIFAELKHPEHRAGV